MHGYLIPDDLSMEISFKIPLKQHWKKFKQLKIASEAKLKN